MNPKTGAAWLSSARAVSCWVKSRNERNPCSQLPSGRAGHSGKTASVNGEEGGDDVKSSWPLRLGQHTDYNGAYKGKRSREAEPNSTNASQSGQESATRLLEVGIASHSGSACRGECVPGPCTHRPSHHESRFYPKPVSQPAMEAAVYGRADDWGEVVTR